MKLKDVVELLDCTIFTPENYKEDYDLNYGFGSDLMSDALMLLRTAPEEFFEEGMLLTGLVTNQSIRTAEMLDFQVVMFVRNKKPSQAVIDGAIESGIMLLNTPYSMFSTAGKLWEKGVRGVSDL